MYMYGQTFLKILISKKRHCSRKCSKVKKKNVLSSKSPPPPLKNATHTVHCKYFSTMTLRVNTYYTYTLYVTCINKTAGQNI